MKSVLSYFRVFLVAIVLIAGGVFVWVESASADQGVAVATSNHFADLHGSPLEVAASDFGVASGHNSQGACLADCDSCCLNPHGSCCGANGAIWAESVRAIQVSLAEAFPAVPFARAMSGVDPDALQRPPANLA